MKVFKVSFEKRRAYRFLPNSFLNVIWNYLFLCRIEKGQRIWSELSIDRKSSAAWTGWSCRRNRTCAPCGEASYRFEQRCASVSPYIDIPNVSRATPEIWSQIWNLPRMVPSKRRHPTKHFLWRTHFQTYICLSSDEKEISLSELNKKKYFQVFSEPHGLHLRGRMRDTLSRLLIKGG